MVFKADIIIPSHRKSQQLVIYNLVTNAPDAGIRAPWMCGTIKLAGSTINICHVYRPVAPVARIDQAIPDLGSGHSVHPIEERFKVYLVHTLHLFLKSGDHH